MKTRCWLSLNQFQNTTLCPSNKTRNIIVHTLKLPRVLTAPSYCVNFFIYQEFLHQRNHGWETLIWWLFFGFLTALNFLFYEDTNIWNPINCQLIKNTKRKMITREWKTKPLRPKLRGGCWYLFLPLSLFLSLSLSLPFVC